MFPWETTSQDRAPYRVLLKRGELLDESRRNDDGSPRHVPFKFYYPDMQDRASHEKVPLIVWSHGYGGSRDGAAFLARHLAEQGYALAHLTHAGTDSSLWEGQKAHPWEILKDLTISRTTTLNRYRDPSFFLDAFPQWVEETLGQALDVDWGHIGMSGHSFGAITTQVLSGQLTPDESNHLISLHDPRITASIAYSPVPGTSHLSGDVEEAAQNNIYASIKTPILLMTGTQDSSPINDMPYTQRLQIYEAIHQAPKALLIKEEGDHMVYNGTRGALAANPLRDRHEELIKTLSLAWWQAWLRQDEAAQDWLKSPQAQAYIGQDGQWSYSDK